MKLLDKFRHIRFDRHVQSPKDQAVDVIIDPWGFSYGAKPTDLAYHLERNSLPSAHVFRGTEFEHRVIHRLRSSDYGFSIQHCGKTGDGGVDFRGSWDAADIRVIIGQCKLSGKAVSVRHIRELEGSFTALKKDDQDHAAAVIASNALLSQAAKMRMDASIVPMIFVHMPASSISAFDLNAPAQRLVKNVKLMYSLKAAGADREVIVIKTAEK